jgi:hypothetical protein
MRKNIRKLVGKEQPKVRKKNDEKPIKRKAKAKEGNQYYFGCDDTGNFSVSIKKAIALSVKSPQVNTRLKNYLITS